MTTDLTNDQVEVVQHLPAHEHEIADELDTTASAVRGRLHRIDGDRVERNENDNWVWQGEPLNDGRDDLRKREAYIYQSLPAHETALAEDLGISKRAVRAHLDEIERKGWTLEDDEDGNYLGPDQDHLRSSEHKGTRTKKANRWWQSRHDRLVHDFQNLQTPDTTLTAYSGNEDWVTHMTDLHAGDFVRRDDGTVVYSTEMIPSIVDYITEKSLNLAAKHGSQYDTAHLLWGGDFVTNSGIYEGQFEDLDAWLDEQHETLIDPLIRQVKAFSEEFDSVQIVGMTGNHGEHRASGTSRQANADLILYKTVRNTIAQIRDHSEGDFLENVQFVLGEAKPYRNFEMRGGKLRGHLRHGQNRKPQAVTAAGSNEWRGTYIDHRFTVAYVGHRHIAGRVPWDGPPIYYSASPKPAGDFVERIGGRDDRPVQDMALCHGIADDGVTGEFFIDSRDFEGL